MARPGYEDSVAGDAGAAPAGGVLYDGGDTLGSLTAGGSLSHGLGALQESDNGTP